MVKQVNTMSVKHLHCSSVVWTAGVSASPCGSAKCPFEYRPQGPNHLLWKPSEPELGEVDCPLRFAVWGCWWKIRGSDRFCLAGRKERRRVGAWERVGCVWGGKNQGEGERESPQGWPSSSLLSGHSPAHADRFIGYNNHSVAHYITPRCSLCTGSSCNWLLHLELTINITQLYTWTENITLTSTSLV